MYILYSVKMSSLCDHIPMRNIMTLKIDLVENPFPVNFRIFRRFPRLIEKIKTFSKIHLHTIPTTRNHL